MPFISSTAKLSVTYVTAANIYYILVFIFVLCLLCFAVIWHNQDAYIRWNRRPYTNKISSCYRRSSQDFTRSALMHNVLSRSTSVSLSVCLSLSLSLRRLCNVVCKNWSNSASSVVALFLFLVVRSFNRSAGTHAFYNMSLSIHSVTLDILILSIFVPFRFHLFAVYPDGYSILSTASLSQWLSFVWWNHCSPFYSSLSSSSYSMHGPTRRQRHEMSWLYRISSVL